MRENEKEKMSMNLKNGNYNHIESSSYQMSNLHRDHMFHLLASYRDNQNACLVYKRRSETYLKGLYYKSMLKSCGA